MELVAAPADAPPGAGEFRRFVDDSVVLEHISPERGEPSFSRLAGRIAGEARDETGLISAGVIAAAGFFAALAPHAHSLRGSFWRVAAGQISELLSALDALVAPIFCTAAVALIVAGVAEFRPLHAAAALCVSGAALLAAVAVAVLWLGVIAIVALNAVALALIITLYVIAAVVAIAFVVGLLSGMATR